MKMWLSCGQVDYKEEAVQPSMLCCPSSAVSPETSNQWQPPRAGLSLFLEWLKSHRICHHWWKKPLFSVFLMCRRVGCGRGGVGVHVGASSSVHAALNFQIGASYLFIRCRLVFEWRHSSNSSDEMMMHEKSREVLENITTNWDVACCPITSEHMRSSSDACQSMKQVSDCKLRKTIPRYKNIQCCMRNYQTLTSENQTPLRYT